MRRPYCKNQNQHIQFQFTHPWGCDFLLELFWIYSRCFNSRTREDATRLLHFGVYLESFNSRTREDATYYMCQNLFQDEFQFTHPWGCDHIGKVMRSKNTCFNSRTREDATRTDAHAARRFGVSIHAPVRMRLKIKSHKKPLLKVSIHAPVRMRHNDIMLSSLFFVSIHAPVRMRPGLRHSRICAVVSIHAPVRMRRDCLILYDDYYIVSIHAPVRMRLMTPQVHHENPLFQFTHPWGCDFWTMYQKGR